MLASSLKAYVKAAARHRNRFGSNDLIEKDTGVFDQAWAWKVGYYHSLLDELIELRGGPERVLALIEAQEEDRD